MSHSHNSPHVETVGQEEERNSEEKLIMLTKTTKNIHNLDYNK